MHPPPPTTISVSARSEPPALAFIALIVANAALAFGPWFVRMADVGPVSAAFWRIALAAPLLLVAALAIERAPPRLGRGLWITLALAGVFFAADLASWHIGILKTTLANATLFGNSTTLILPIYGFLVARAWPNRWQATALLLAAAGAALLLGQSWELSPQNVTGDLLCILAGLLYTFYLIAMTRARTAMTPLPALALSTLASVLPLLGFALLLGERIVPGNWGPLIGLALVSQVIGQGLMIYALGHLSPLIVGLALLTQPIVAGAIGWIVYDERLGPLEWIGAALVAAALVLVRREPGTPAPLAPPGASATS